MKISVQWLKEIMPSLRASKQKIAEGLTLAGLEVEAVTEHGLDSVLVGLVRSKEKHPNADRLSLCRVWDGHQELQVVCGAPNVLEGGLYPFAPVGAILPNGLEIKKATIRNVESFGMLCSASELGLAYTGTGLLPLSAVKVGATISKALKLKDTILEVNITPNRGDCFSHVGIAREVAALFDLPLKTSKHFYKPAHQEKISVRIHDKKGCPRYTSCLMHGVEVKPSPLWLQLRLERLGIRSINNLVDATNILMLETGHPVHAFDARFIEGNEIHIRSIHEETSLITLDDVERKLVPGDLVITDQKKIVALAGIMGGKNSGVQSDTSAIILEVAQFDASRIRRTTKRLGLSTESSLRFERNVPGSSVGLAMEGLIQLIGCLAGGRPGPIHDLYPKVGAIRRVPLRRDRIRQVLGMEIPDRRITQILKSLNLSPKKLKAGWSTMIPEYRSDLNREIDLIEEVVRLQGMGSIKPELPKMAVGQAGVQGEREDLARNFFVSLGFLETIHLSFCPENGDVNSHALQNPLSQEEGCLRSSLLPKLLQLAESQSGPIRFFELRCVFEEQETQRLAGILGGTNAFPSWARKPRKIDFYDGKGILESFFKNQKCHVEFMPDTHPHFHPDQCLRLQAGDQVLGYYGLLHPSLTHKNGELYYFDLDFKALVNVPEETIHCREISPFPSVTRDLALVVEQSLTHQQILSAIHGKKVEWLKKISLFDVYQGENLEEGKKSLAFTLVYENPLRTLTDEEVNAEHFGLVSYLEGKLQARLR